MKSVLFGVMVCCATSVLGREWNDSSGDYRTEADLISHRDSDASVLLRKQNGAQVRVPLSRLSEADRQFVELFVASTSTEDLPPGPPQTSFLKVSTAGSEKTPVIKTAQAMQSRQTQQPRQRTQGANGQYAMAPADYRSTYKGCDHWGCSFDFHLLPNPQGQPVGSGEYWYHGGHLLDFLTYIPPVTSPPPPAAFLFYAADPVNPANVWAFSTAPWINGCHHVWYQPVAGGPFKFFGFAHYEVLH